MTWADLMPAKAVDHYRRAERAPFPALDVLRALEFETMIVVGVAAAIGVGTLPNEADRQRVHVAHSRILAGLRLAGGGV
ncbi:Putative DNA primase (fragment) [Thiomonas delicata]|uniref:Putative DNA primase n=2 Tax=Thiomonas delicata TaxID=364030 RepID=A0A238D7W7_THIDL